MKSYLRSAALLLIGLSTAVPVLAECPDGKSEVLLMTPSGITKTICVSDNAIPGIENAAENTGGFTLEPACPCASGYSQAVAWYTAQLDNDIQDGYDQCEITSDLTIVEDPDPGQLGDSHILMFASARVEPPTCAAQAGVAGLPLSVSANYQITEDQLAACSLLLAPLCD